MIYEANMFGVVFVLLFCAITGIQSSPKIDGPCKRGDRQCFTRIANDLYTFIMKGDEALKLEPLDPMKQDHIEGDLAVLKYKLYNTSIVGFSKCKIVNSILADNDSQLNFKLNCPVIHMTGDYETSGQLLGLPVEGKGDFKLEATDYDTEIEAKIKTTKSDDGKEYLSFKNFKIDGSLKGGSFYLSNLFNGQKDLADTFHKFVNDNWVTVAKELQGPIFTATVKRVFKSLNKTFRTIPHDQLLQE